METVVSVEEKFGARILGDDSAETSFIVKGTDDDVAARQAVLDQAPASHDGKDRDEVELEEVAPGIWLASVRYAASSNDQTPPPETGDSVFNFETGGGTQRITQARQHVASYAPVGKTAPDHKGAIGVTPDGVEGCDVVVPVYRWSETHYLDASVVTTAYRGTLFRLTGRMNNSLFKGNKPGECLFLGASGSKRGRGDWEVSYAFMSSPSVTNLEIAGGRIVVSEKLGHDYLWFEYALEEDPVAQRMTRRPIAAHVERVYLPDDFSQLGIGV